MIQAGILTFGLGAQGEGIGAYTPTSDFRPTVDAVTQIPGLYAEGLEPGTDSSGEAVAEVYSEGVDRASVLTDQLRPVILETEIEENV